VHRLVMLANDVILRNMILHELGKGARLLSVEAGHQLFARRRNPRRARRGVARQHGCTCRCC